MCFVLYWLLFTQWKCYWIGKLDIFFHVNCKVSCMSIDGVFNTTNKYKHVWIKKVCLFLLPTCLDFSDLWYSISSIYIYRIGNVLHCVESGWEHSWFLLAMIWGMGAGSIQWESPYLSEHRTKVTQKGNNHTKIYIVFYAYRK